MYFNLLFASAYSSTPRPPCRHIHPTFQPVRIEWACSLIDFPGWYFVKPIHRELAPILYGNGWYVHHSHLHLIQIFFPHFIEFLEPNQEEQP